MRQLYLTVCEFTDKYLVTGHRTSGTWNDTKTGTGFWEGVFGEVFSTSSIRGGFGSICTAFTAGFFFSYRLVKR